MKLGFVGSCVILLASAVMASGQSAQPAPSEMPQAETADAGDPKSTPGIPGQKAEPRLLPAPTIQPDRAPSPHERPVELDGALASSCDSCDRCGSSQPFNYSTYNCWVSSEYLLSWLHRGPLPVPILASPGPAGGGGALLFGTNGLDYRSLSGLRLTAGTWLDVDSVFGVEASGFMLEQGSAAHRLSSDQFGAPALIMPFFNAATGQADFFPISTPGAFAGTFSATSTSQVWGTELNMVFNLFRDYTFAFDLIAGLRYVQLREKLDIETSFSPLPGAQASFGGGFFDPPAVVVTRDRFATRNSFGGGQFGFRTECRFGDFFASLAARLALGDSHEIVEVEGSTTLQRGITPQSALPGGIFALPSNSGRSSTDQFAVLSEVDCKLGYQMTSRLNIYAGYTFLYLSSVARPGEQINPNLNPGLVPSATNFGTIPGAVPQPIIRTTDFWAQGVSFGLEFRY